MEGSLGSILTKSQNPIGKEEELETRLVPNVGLLYATNCLVVTRHHVLASVSCSQNILYASSFSHPRVLQQLVFLPVLPAFANRTRCYISHTFPEISPS